MAVLTVRPFETRDYRAAIAIGSSVYPDHPWSEEEWRHEDARYDGTRFTLHRLVAEDADGKLLGVAEFHHVPSMYHPNKLWVEILVHPQRQGRGIGTRLYEALTAAMRPFRPIVTWAGVRETLDRGIRFAQDRGFREVRRVWELRLDVTRFDPTPFAEKAAAAVAGFTTTTVDELRRRDPRWLPKLFDLHTAVDADVPRPDAYTPLGKDHFVQHTLEHPDYLPDAHVVLLAGDQYVGESFMLRSQQLSDVLYQGLTATTREYRGRGLALAIKLQTIEYARTHGYREIRTWNDSLNMPMLHINAALGFARQPAWITFERRLEEP
ncbi:MAG: hypothetical protein AUI83_09845 [Armatimonadetes bacterium 13_1_40CM_3_65_7]|nr:MAG: hypothetical protein AUI83_09845 [Armatimonadetes bacterium 13_1_40CM_3_65_7]